MNEEEKMFSEVYAEEYMASGKDGEPKFVYRDKISGVQITEKGELPLEYGYPPGIEPNTEDAQIYDAKRLRIYGFPRNKLDAEEILKVKKMREGSQITDKNWITASKILHTFLEEQGTSLAQNMIVEQSPDGLETDKDYAEWGRDWMSAFNNNLSYMTMDYAKLSDAPPDVARAFYYLMETSDREGMLMKNFKTGLYYTMQDPINYAGLTTLGAFLIPKYFGKQAMKETIKKSLVKKIFGKPSKAQYVMGVESGAYVSLDDAVRQNVAMDVDVQDEFNYFQNATATAVGTAAGVGLTRGVEVVSDVVEEGVKKVAPIVKNALTDPDNTQLQDQIDINVEGDK